MSGTQNETTNDHTYAENSDIPMEPYGSDSNSKLDAVTMGVTPGGRLIVASTDKLEISVEYSNSTALLEETGMTQNASEMLLDASNTGIVRPNMTDSTNTPLLDEHTDHEVLLEETDHSNETLPDGTNNLLPDVTVSDKVSLEATEHTNELIPDETCVLLPAVSEHTSDLLPDKTSEQLLETTDDPVSSNQSEDAKAATDETSTNNDKTLDIVPTQGAPTTTATTETGNECSVVQLTTYSQDCCETVNMPEHQEGQSTVTDSMTAATADANSNVITSNTTQSEPGHSGESTTLVDATVEKVIGEIS